MSWLGPLMQLERQSPSPLCSEGMAPGMVSHVLENPLPDDAI